MLLISGLLNPPQVSAEQPAFDGSPTLSGLGGVRQFFEIRGTGNRNNPLRWRLDKPFRGSELLVQFQFRYDADSVDTPAEGDGEFFVLWLDETDGGDRATHSGGVPNLGIHVADDQNRLMVRFASGPINEVFSEHVLQGDREYSIVAKLEADASDSASDGDGERQFRRLSLWVDPKLTEFREAHAVATTKNGPAQIEWVGFSTGRKTEPDDRIAVSNVRIASSWEELFGIPQPVAVTESIAEANSSVPEQESVPPHEELVSFADDVYPLLRQKCFDCHSGEGAESGVRLDVLDEVLNAVSPGSAETSRLIEVVSSDNADTRMPPVDAGDPLLEDQILALRSWIDEGANWDESLLPTPIPETDHWAFQSIERPDVPLVMRNSWVRTPVDAFIARRHRQLGITPSGPASPETLRRRIALDLTGLPAHEVVTSPSSEANLHQRIDALAEQLLSSNAYGERWGRHWLDLARWAESNGHQHNRTRPHAWRYRDYVVQSFNSNKPFDEFLKEQIAGDELPYSEEAVIATGFLAAARYSGNELDKEIQRNDILVDVANTTAQTFLGLTMECAQCHTHKFDPISIRDYYRFQAFFNRGQPGNVILQGSSREARLLVDWRWRMYDGVHQRLVESRRANNYPEPILVLPKSVYQSMKGRERENFQQIETELNELPQTWGWYSPASSPNPLATAPHEMRWPLPRDPQEVAALKTCLRPRGDVKTAGPEVQPGWPAVFGRADDVGDRPRTVLAEWMTSPENPLTARVWVNRIWQWHFGQGLVETSGDFGTQGTRPTHPELLDWLACELIDSGWDTRHIHRMILRSNTYRQAAKWQPPGAESNSSDRLTASEPAAAYVHPTNIDPENQSLWHWTPRRMEAESIRDAILSVAGILDRSMHGPSVDPQQVDTSVRRSIYLGQVRDKLPHQQDLFDGANAITSCSHRRTSTVPLQPLYLMNSEFAQRTAAAFAERLRKQSEDPVEQVREAIRLTLERPATADEVAQLNDFRKHSTLQDLCLVLLNLNEFVYLP